MKATIPMIAAWGVATIFALAAIINLAGPRPLRDLYRRWGYPRGFHRTTGALELLAAVFLALPQTRIWGVAIAAIVLFFATIILLSRRQYLYAVPSMVLLAALPPALLASAL